MGNGGVGTLTIEDQGVVSAGTNLFIAATSNVNLNGGTLRFNTITGITRLNYNAGTLQLAGNRDIIFDSNLFDFYGASRLIPAGKGLTVEGTTTIRQQKSITVSGGKLTSQGTLIIGALGGDGSLSVNSGGTVIANAGSSINDFGTALVTGAGSSWNIAGNLQISPAGNRGDLFVSNQGSLYVGGTLSIGSSGTLNLNGGTVRFDGYSRNVIGNFAFVAGTVQLAGNRTLGSDAATVDLFGASPTIPTGKAPHRGRDGPPHALGACDALRRRSVRQHRFDESWKSTHDHRKHASFWNHARSGRNGDRCDWRQPHRGRRVQGQRLLRQWYASSGTIHRHARRR